jgi:UDP-hydrolysing UDP-N-acetyl-D-glucosamine 2-epimerase
MNPRICVATTSRADYGLLKGVMTELRASRALSLQLLVSGSHLAPEFGETVSEIERDGFRVDARADLRPYGSTALDVAGVMSRALSGGAAALAELRPDLMLVLGDRYEVMALVAAATVLRVPVGHIAGGDTTEGAFDEVLRHSITKMAHLHFVTNDLARRRVIQMGERPETVHDTGSPGIDAVLRAPKLDRAAVEKALAFRLRERNLLITFHPVTLDAQPAAEQVAELLAALAAMGSEVGLVFTHANADPEGLEVSRMLEQFVAGRDNAIVRSSLGSDLYLGVMGLVDAVVGNSSSGLYEAPSLRKPAVNIGDRQRGRLAAASVVHCAPRRADIVAAIRQALALDCSRVVSPYGSGGASKRIVKVLEGVADFGALLRKPFHLLPAAGAP